jgi:hypothetical protein
MLHALDEKQKSNPPETGSDKYRSLDSATFVGAGHFVVEDGAVWVEYKFSQVIV